jgi:hypothetical protein
MSIKVLQFPVRNTGGGITQYALNNWKYIDKPRFQFDFATCDKQKLDFEDELAAQGCRVHHLSCYAEDDYARFCAEFNAILDGGYAAVHLHTSHWKSFSTEEIAAARAVPAVIVHSHNTGIGGMPAGANLGEAMAVHNAKKQEFTANLATTVCLMCRL